MAAVNAGAGERLCYKCGKPGHICEECSELPAVVRLYLKNQREQGRRGHGRGKGCGKGRGGQGVAAISMADVQRMVDSLPGAEATFLPSKWLVESGFEINICFNYKQFYICPSDISECVPIGSEPVPVEGKGVVRMCVGQYVECNGLCHLIDLEIDDVYWVPWSPMNVLATPALGEQNMHLFTGPRGNDLATPGLADQVPYEHGNFMQTEDGYGNPTVVSNLGKGRPILHAAPVDDVLCGPKPPMSCNVTGCREMLLKFNSPRVCIMCQLSFSHILCLAIVVMQCCT